MPNKQLFQDRMRHERVTDTTNSAGGTAYSKEPEIALAQIATTGTFGDTFYRKATDQVDTILELAEQVSPEFLAKLAVYARSVGKMKDMPAYLVTFLLVKAKKDESYAPWAEAAFKAVADNGRMIRNVVLFLRSGKVLGNKSLGTRAQRLISKVLNEAKDYQIINWSVGNDPSLADVIKLARPSPAKVPASPHVTEASRRGLYAWVIGKEIKDGKVDGKPATHPLILRDLLAFQKDPTSVEEVPNVEFRLLTGMKLPVEVWRKIALNSGYQRLRMNLQAFHKQGVFEDAEVAAEVAKRLRDREAIIQSGVFPYQQWVAARQLRGISGFPRSISDAMEDAVDITLDNVPTIHGNVVVCIDISSSMSTPVTGYGSSGRASTVRCVDAAALIAAGITRKNPDAFTLLFNERAYPFKLSHRDSVVSNAEHIASKMCGGTSCGAAMSFISTAVNGGLMPVPDLVVMVSDNESWADRSLQWGRPASYTSSLEAWKRIHAKNHKAKFICLDITPNRNQQVPDAPNRATIGGFSDDTFKMISDLYEGRVEGPELWIKRISEISLDPIGEAR